MREIMALRSESSHQYSRQKRIFFMRLEHGLALWSAFESIFWFGLFCIALKLGSIFATTSDLMDFMDETESNWYFRKIFGEIDYVDQQIRSECKEMFFGFENSNELCHFSALFAYPLRPGAGVCHLLGRQFVSSRSNLQSKAKVFPKNIFFQPTFVGQPKFSNAIRLV